MKDLIFHFLAPSKLECGYIGFKFKKDVMAVVNKEITAAIFVTPCLKFNRSFSIREPFILKIKDMVEVAACNCIIVFRASPDRFDVVQK